MPLTELMRDVRSRVRKERKPYCIAAVKSSFSGEVGGSWHAFSSEENLTQDDVPYFVIEPVGKKEDKIIPLTPEALATLLAIWKEEEDVHFGLLAEVEDERTNLGYYGIRGR